MVPSGPMRSASLRFWTLTLVLLTVVAPTRRTLAAEGGAPPVWDLVTVGPDADLFSLWGHSALCASAGSFERGTCFDFGVAHEDDPARLAVGTLRGRPLFGVVKVPARVLLATVQFRDTWHQRIELDPGPSRALLAELEALVQARMHYAYQPLFRNCTTELRDRLDHALAGRLRAGADQETGPPLRGPAEGGLTGQVLPLALLALAGGSVLDRPSTEWERMALPAGLMLGVKSRLSAAPSRVFSREGAPPPTSSQAGRSILIVLSALGFAGFALLLRRAPTRRGLVSTLCASWLVLLSLVPLVGALSALPSLHQNWMLAILTPLDAVLFARADWGRLSRHYVKLRLALLLALTLASGLGLVVQPLLTGAIVSASPLLLWLRAERA